MGLQEINYIAQSDSILDNISKYFDLGSEGNPPSEPSQTPSAYPTQRTPIDHKELFSQTAPNNLPRDNFSLMDDGFNQIQADPSILLHEPSLILAIAIIIEMFLPFTRKFKLCGLMTIFNRLAAKVNRPAYGSNQQSFAGVMLPFLILLFFYSLTLFIDVFTGFDPIIQVIILIWILELKYPQDKAVAIYKALKQKNKKLAINELLPFVLRETDKLSAMGIAKAGCESAILRIFHSWFCVAFYYLAFGLEGAVLMQLITIIGQSNSYKLSYNLYYGRAIYLLRNIMTFLPAIILVLIASIGLKPMPVLKQAIQGFKTYPCASSGLVLGAIGAKTNTSLGGPRYYIGKIYRYAKIGGSQEPNELSVLKNMRTIRLCGLLFLVFAIMIDLNFF